MPGPVRPQHLHADDRGGGCDTAGFVARQRAGRRDDPRDVRSVTPLVAAGTARIDHVDTRRYLPAQPGHHRHARIEHGDPDALAGDAGVPRTEIARPRLVGANRDVGHCHLPANNVIAGELGNVVVVRHLGEAPRGNIEHRAARQAPPHAEPVTSGNRIYLSRASHDDDRGRRRVAGIKMSFEIVGDVTPAGLSAGRNGGGDHESGCAKQQPRGAQHPVLGGGGGEPEGHHGFGPFLPACGRLM